MIREVAVCVVVTTVVAAILSGLLPVLATKLILRLYPRDDPRRRELLAELCDLTARMGDSGKDVTWEQTQSELVRVVENDRVVRWEVERSGDRDCRRRSARHVSRVHRTIVASTGGGG